MTHTMKERNEKGTAIYEENIEEAVIAGCIMDRAALGGVLAKLRAEMFYTDRHRIVYEALGELYSAGTPVDLITVTEHLRRQGRLDEAGGVAHIAGMCARLVSTAHIDAHCALLFEYHVRRELVRHILPLMGEVNDVTSDVFDLILRMQKVLDALYSDTPLESHLHDMPEVMKLTLQNVERRQATSADGLTGVPTGFAELDQLTGGWQNGNLIYVAGRPGDGKSALTLHMARAAAAAGTPVTICTLEMKAEEIGERMALSVSEADPQRMRQGRLTPDEVDSLRRTAGDISSLPIRVDDTPYMSIDQLCVLVKTLHAKGQCGMVIVDYL